MRTDSFSKEKHLPVRRFIADESKVATGLYGPRAIADDIDNLCAMFDPGADILGGTQKGGISAENLQDGAVTYHKLQADIREKMEGSETKQDAEDREARLIKLLDAKAEKSDTLSGYGITDAYTKKETEGFVQNKLEEIVLHEVTVDVAPWANPVTFEGALDSKFNTTDVFYVTLQNTDGTPLENGTFKLMNNWGEHTTAYDTLFQLETLSGETELAENLPVEIVTIGTSFLTVRPAGVWEVAFTPNDWKLNGEKGTLKITTFGEFVQRAHNAYFVSLFTTNKNVSSYHSVNSTAFQSDTTKQITPYASLGVANYKTNKFYDECIIERNGETRYSTKRMVSQRYIKQDSTSYTVSSHDVFGYGEIMDTDTLITKVNIQAAVNKDRGVIRNGSVICVSEVK